MRFLDVESILEQRGGQRLLRQIMASGALLGLWAILEACKGLRGVDP